MFALLLRGPETLHREPGESRSQRLAGRSAAGCGGVPGMAGMAMGKDLGKQRDLAKQKWVATWDGVGSNSKLRSECEVDGSK